VIDDNSRRSSQNGKAAMFITGSARIRPRSAAADFFKSLRCARKKKITFVSEKILLKFCQLKAGYVAIAQSDRRADKTSIARTDHSADDWKNLNDYFA